MMKKSLIKIQVNDYNSILNSNVEFEAKEGELFSDNESENKIFVYW